MTAVATCPPGMTCSDWTSAFDPGPGKFETEMSVSVAFSPTPTRSTVSDFICAEPHEASLTHEVIFCDSWIFEERVVARDHCDSAFRHKIFFAVGIRIVA